MLYTMEHGRRVINPGNGEAWVENRNASPSYVAISPDVIKQRLLDAGFEVKMSFPRFHNKPMRRTVLTVKRPGLDRDFGSDDYVNLASLCFDHQGRMTLRGQPGALRLDCDNEFYASPLRIHHCSQAARDFLANPVPFVEELMRVGEWIPRRIESLRGVDNGAGCASHMATWLTSQRKKLGARVLRYMPRYVRQDGYSAWTFVQAVTNAQHDRLHRSPALDNLATNLITVGYDALVQGHTPVGDALLTVAPQLYDFDTN